MERSLAILLLLLATAPAAAQQIRLSGRVVDAHTGELVAGAWVALVDQQTGRRIDARYADDRGAFAFGIRGATQVVLQGVRFGYQEGYYALEVDYRFSQAQVELRLTPKPIALDPLDAVARPRTRASPVLEAYEFRRAKGLGLHFTRGDIERLAPHLVTDLLATVPGARLLSSGRGSRRVLSFGHSPGRPDCPAQIFVDGLAVNRQRAGAPAASGGADPVSIDDLVAPQSIEGIEIFRGLATVPPEFLSPDAVCGVVAIWTRRGH